MMSTKTIGSAGRSHSRDEPGDKAAHRSGRDDEPGETADCGCGDLHDNLQCQHM